MQNNNNCKPLTHAQSKELCRLVWEYVGAARKYEYHDRDPEHLPELNAAMNAFHEGLNQVTNYGQEN